MKRLIVVCLLLSACDSPPRHEVKGAFTEVHNYIIQLAAAQYNDRVELQRMKKKVAFKIKQLEKKGV